MIMIKQLIFIMAIATLTVFCIPFEAKSQCGDELTSICHAKLGNARFIRSFPVQHGEVDRGTSPRVTRYEIILNRGTTYRIFACNDKTKPGRVIVSLYRGDQLIATTYDVETGRHFPFIEYPVNMSGRYSLQFMFKGGKEGCAVGILSTVN